MKKIILAVMLLLSLFSGLLLSAQSDSSHIKLNNPPSVHKPFGYSQVADIDLGKSRMLIISGQVALDKDGNLVGKNDLAAQTEQVYQNIKAIIESSGGQMKDLVKTNIFLLDASQVQTVRTIRDKYVNIQQPPASTLVEVRRLFRDDILIEIEAIAIIPKKGKKKKR